ncbi:MAG: sensor histidine kinase, partial [Kibdelosporangium sp.]
MRRRILLAILLAVAVTACALGIPLGYFALQIVESGNRAELKTRAQQIGLELDDDLAANRPLDIPTALILVPPNGRLLVQLPDEPIRGYGP